MAIKIREGHAVGDLYASFACDCLNIVDAIVPRRAHRSEALDEARGLGIAGGARDDGLVHIVERNAEGRTLFLRSSSTFIAAPRVRYIVLPSQMKKLRKSGSNPLL